MSILTMRLPRVVVLLALLGATLAAGTARVAAQELDDNVFTDEEYGWSVEFDDGFWEAEAVEERGSQGVALTGTGAVASLVVYDDGITDDAECLDDLDRAYSDSDAWDGLAPARSLDAPETAADAEATLYAGTLVLESDELDAALYLECREVEEATLSVIVTVAEDSYEDVLPTLEELLAAIETSGGSSSQDDETPESDDRDADETSESDDDPSADDVEIEDGLSGATYGNSEYGLLVEWDDEWTGDELDEGIGVFLSREVEDAISLAQIQIRTDVDATDVEACAEEFAEELGGLVNIGDLEEARGLDAPETDAAAAGAVYSYTFTTTDDTELPLVSYLECRALGEDAALRVELTADALSYEDQVEDFSDFLSGIQVVSIGSETDDEETPERDEPDADETPESDDDDVALNDVGAGDLDDDTFTDTALGYAFTWDDAVWTGELLEDAETAGVFLSTDDEELFATVTVDASLGYEGIDPEQCIADYVDSLETVEGYSPFQRERSLVGPGPARGGAGEVYSYTFTYEDGEEGELVAYVECRPIDDASMIRIIVQTSEQSLEENLDVFEELLAGIEIDGGAEDGGDEDDENLGPDEEDEETPASDDEETPTPDEEEDDA